MSAPRILVVDDEPGVREGCRKVLVAEGYDVTVAEDGRAGLEKFEVGGPFEVLLVDLMMPRMGGLELMRTVLERDPDVVPLIITAHATIDTAVEGTRQGAWSYIPKPFTADELLLALKNGLERRALALEAGASVPSVSAGCPSSPRSVRAAPPSSRRCPTGCS